MQTIHVALARRKAGHTGPRRGSVLVLAAVVIAIIFAMTAFAVDLGYISMTKTQLQSGVDSSALAAALELTNGLGSAPTKTSSQVVVAGNAAANSLALLHRNGNLSSSYLDTTRDLRYGQLSWDAVAGKWAKTYGTAPYNLVEVTLRRDQTSTTHGDSRLPLLFGKTVGMSDTSITETAAAGLLPGVGVKILPGNAGTVGILPITLDVPTWNALMGGTGSDNYRYDPTTGIIGKVDLGSPSNSTSDIKRQILYGLNASDLSYFGGVITTDNGPITLNGDTGISAGIKAELDAIKGQPRLIPLFTQVAGPGNNAMYTITKFVPIRILNVKLTGNPKSVVVQPAPFSSPLVVPGHISVTSDSYFTSPRLVQ